MVNCVYIKFPHAICLGMESVTTYLVEVLRITFLWILFFSDASINNILSNIAGVIEDYFLLIFGERESKQTIGKWWLSYTYTC